VTTTLGQQRGRVFVPPTSSIAALAASPALLAACPERVIQVSSGEQNPELRPHTMFVPTLLSRPKPSVTQLHGGCPRGQATDLGVLLGSFGLSQLFRRLELGPFAC
jgi:poly(3-hydroxybutyrate) depolymerase